MSTYVMSDIHGEYDTFLKMLDKIKFADDDKLIIDGDVVDRGDKPISTLLYIMKHKNMELLCGNHEYMACTCLKFLINEFVEESLNDFGIYQMSQLIGWQENGCASTIRELKKYGKEIQNNIYNYLLKLKIYKQIKINDKKYLIVHAGLGNFKKNKKLKDYTINELVWERFDYSKKYYDDKTIITGHTPTCIIEGNKNPNKIYIANNNIDLDCGCTYGGRLGCLRLEDMKEYYVKKI